MTINFYLDSKQNSKEEKAIYCYVRGLAQGKTIYINIGKKSILSIGIKKNNANGRLLSGIRNLTPTSRK